MMIITISDVDLGGKDLTKVAQRGLFKNQLTNLGITSWSYSYATNELTIKITDFFDFSKLQNLGVSYTIVETGVD